MRIFDQLKMLVVKNYALFSYLLVGVFCVIIYFLSFAFLWQLMGVNYQIAVTITYILTVLFHFSANRRFTFNAQGGILVHHVAKYICMIIGNYVITLSIMYLVVEIIHLIPYVGIFFAMVTNTCVNFIVARYWVFRVVS